MRRLILLVTIVLLSGTLVTSAIAKNDNGQVNRDKAYEKAIKIQEKRDKARKQVDKLMKERIKKIKNDDAGDTGPVGG